MTEIASPLVLERLGEWTDVFEVSVELEHAERYAAAVNYPAAQLRKGDFVPPIFAALMTRRALHTATAWILPPDLARTALMVHGEHDLHFEQALRVGMRLRTRALPVGVRVGHAGTALLFQLETRDSDGELVSTQFHTSFLPGLTQGRSGGGDIPEHRMPSGLELRRPEATSVVSFAKDQTYRYADVSGDHTPIHVDDTFARSRGFPGVIVHGLCTMAVVTRGLVEVLAEGDATQVRRVAVRFSRNVFPGQSLTSHVWSGREDRAHHFETVNDAGDRVIAHGLIALR